MPLVQTRGAASAQGFGEFAQVTAVNYIEDVFSTYLYTGTGAALTVTNNIDLSTKGGLTWIKGRSGATGHRLTDTARGVTKSLASETTAAEATETTGLTAFGTTGFTIGADADYNTSAATYVSWTFREQPKFFDVVTYTGNATNRTIAHSLGSVPGSIIVKRTDTAADWAVYHRSLANTDYLTLNTTAAVATGATRWNSTTATSAVFSLGTDATVNASAGTYVAYVFAHDAGGFGLAGTDNVISCGTFTNSGSTVDINLGYEAQFVLMKKSSGTGEWFLFDVMRGMSETSFEFLYANLNGAAEPKSYQGPFATATGFSFNPVNNGQFTNGDYIYIACRRGPMKVPTLGTSVFGVISALEPVSTNQTTQNGVLTDTVVNGLRVNQGGFGPHWLSRLTGNGAYLISSSTDAEVTQGNFWKFDNNNFAYIPPNGYANNNGAAKYVAYSFRRAPGFFDEVCYTGTGANATITHNLGVAPEMIIVKGRSAAGYYWNVFQANMGVSSVIYLNFNDAVTNSDPRWQSTAPTSTSFFVNNYGQVNGSGITFVAYLFATCAGVSKVGSYTGTGTTLQVDCGFTAGSRFILIKRTDVAGDWYVWDSARGIVAGNDPYLLLNSTAAEVTNTDYVDTYSAGFEISSTAPAAINASAGSFIFLAIA